MVKNLPANAENAGDAGSVPEFGRSPREGNGNSLQYFCLGNPMDRGAWHAVVLGVARATKHAHPCLHLEYRYKIVTHSGI